MSKPIVLSMYVGHAATNADKPDESFTALRLQLSPKSERVDDANREHFPSDVRKACNIEVQGIAEASIDGVKAGRRAKVTIEFE